MVVGESQILGQVKEAYQSAINAGTVGRVLSQLMHRAISVAKRIRT
jgi:glutamyl-tRNA reductase